MLAALAIGFPLIRSRGCAAYMIRIDAKRSVASVRALLTLRHFATVYAFPRFTVRQLFLAVHLNCRIPIAAPVDYRRTDPNPTTRNRIDNGKI